MMGGEHVDTDILPSPRRLGKYLEIPRYVEYVLTCCIQSLRAERSSFEYPV